MNLVAEVADRLMALTEDGDRCLVAVSGGPDSMALLDLLHRGTALHRRILLVGHVDHGIADESTAVAQMVARAANALGLPCLTTTLHLGAGTTETKARLARRTALRALATDAGATVIVLAHHADDQAETVLLRLLRGSGPAGLAGMAPRNGPWVRPLLDLPRERLAAHVVAEGIVAWQDPANRDIRHLRSWLRQAVMPGVAARLPDLRERLLTAAGQAREARTGWDQLLDQLPELALTAEPAGFSVAAPLLRGYRSALRHAVVAALGRRCGVPLGARRLAAVDRLLAGRDARIQLAAGLEAELAFGRLAFRHPAGPAPEPVTLGGGAGITFGPLTLRAVLAPAPALDREGWSTAMVPGQYQVRAWQSGDRIRPLGGRGHRQVSVLLREARIAPGRRSHWPVVVDADATIVWVPGICRSDARIPTEGTEALCAHAAFA
ncbi:MAG: tRNA lysidine(34) synthetase TilS [Gemmatimonadetes bacterium]|nr:tRNA lysidine(34) synthetase TilS [Gemmatimonadota bacterium]